MIVGLRRKDCYCGLQDFYTNVAKRMGVTVTGNTCFNCRKICVNKNVKDVIWSYLYNEQKYSNMEIAAMWLAFGPKANLEGKITTSRHEIWFCDVEDMYVAKVEDDFVIG